MSASNIHKEKIPLRKINFVIRDIDTKKILIKEFEKGQIMEMRFNSFYAAHRNLQSLNFGLNEFYEIWDLRTNKLAYKCIRKDTNK